MISCVPEAGVTLEGNRKNVAGVALENLSKETARRLLCQEGKCSYLPLGADELDNMSELLFALVKASSSLRVRCSEQGGGKILLLINIKAELSVAKVASQYFVGHVHVCVQGLIPSVSG